MKVLGDHNKLSTQLKSDLFLRYKEIAVRCGEINLTLGLRKTKLNKQLYTKQ